MRRRWGAVLGWSLFAATSAHAQGTVTSGAASFTFNVGHFDTSPSANFLGVGTPLTQDHLFESGWWYRVSGDTSETALPAPDSQVYAGDTGTITWTDVNAQGFAAQEVIRIIDVGGPSGTTTDIMTITNLGAVPLAIDVFHMADVDVSGPPNDSGTLVSPNQLIEMIDGANSVQYLGEGASAYLARAFNVANDVAGELSNGSVTDFDNTGLPFGPGDITAGFQWASVTIAPGASRSFSTVLSANTPAGSPTTTTTSTSSTTTTSTSTPTSSTSTSTTTTTLPTTTTSTTLSTTSTLITTTTVSSTTTSTLPTTTTTSTTVLTTSTLITTTTVSSTTTSTLPTTTTTSTTVPTTSTLITTTTVSSTTTSTLPPLVESCGNCVDDDGDGLVDFEDADCCSSASGAMLDAVKGLLRSVGEGRAKMKVKARLSTSGLGDDLVSSQDASVQIRNAAGEVFCARIPAASLVRKRDKLSFRDKTGTESSAAGLTKLTLRRKKDGSGRFSAGGRMVALEVPAPGILTMTIGLRDVETAEASTYCASGAAAFRSTKKGLRAP